jgi:hypothetical protein
MNKTVGYWVSTGIFCAALGFGGVAHLMRADAMAQGMEILGYPPYLMTILGTAKVLGVLALLAPGRPLLKEWAYAGFTFNLLGATASHIFVGDPASETVRPALILVLAIASYFLRPPSRRLELATSLQPNAA